MTPNIIETINDIAKNLVEFSDEIKDSQESLSQRQIQCILEETRIEVMKECKSMVKSITDVIDGTSDLSLLKQEQIKIMIESARNEQRNSDEVLEALTSMIRLADAADKDLNLDFFNKLFIEMFDEIVNLLIRIQPNNSKEWYRILYELSKMKN